MKRLFLFLSLCCAMAVFAQDQGASLQETLRQVYPEATGVTVQEGSKKGGWSGALDISGSPVMYEAQVLGEVADNNTTFVLAWIHFPDEDERLYDASFIECQDPGYSPFPARLLVWDKTAPDKVHAVNLGVGSVSVTSVELLKTNADGLEKDIINIRYGTLSALQDPLTQVREVFEAFYSIPGLNHLGTVRLDRVYMSGEMMEADDTKRIVRLVPSPNSEEPAMEIEEIGTAGAHEKKTVGLKDLGREKVTRVWDQAPKNIRTKAQEAQPSDDDLYFRILNEQHHPLKGARIHCGRTEIARFRWENPTAYFDIVTPENGMFSVEGGRVNFTLDVVADGYEGRKFSYGWQERPKGVVDIVLQPLGETVPMLTKGVSHQLFGGGMVQEFGFKLRVNDEFYMVKTMERDAADLWCTIAILDAPSTEPGNRDIRYKVELSGGPGVRLKATAPISRYALRSDWDALNKYAEAPLEGYVERLEFEGSDEVPECVFIEFDGGARYGKLQPISWGAYRRKTSIDYNLTANVILQAEATNSRILRIYPSTQMPKTKKETATGKGR